MNHGGILKKMSGEVICKRDEKIQRKIMMNSGIQRKIIFFDENGKIKTEQNFNQNKQRHGKIIDFHTNGKAKRQYTYKDGINIGPNYVYYENGNKMKVEYIWNNEVSYFEYNIDGTLKHLKCHKNVEKQLSQREKELCAKVEISKK
ncbi:MAG: hypothetical protein H6622_11135 [Halobacteriovoraceae bacterium]|nr:hypothetical protein [Halobacteriovoraceae bacterium]